MLSSRKLNNRAFSLFYRKDKDIVTRYMKLMEIEALYKEGKYKKEKEKNNGKGREIKEHDRQRTL